MSLLLNAIANNNLANVKLILESSSGNYPKSTNELDSNYKSDLFEEYMNAFDASYLKNPKIGKLLLGKLIEFNNSDYDKILSDKLNLNIITNNIEIVKYLLSVVKYSNENKYEALEHALDKRNVEMITLLISSLKEPYEDELRQTLTKKIKEYIIISINENNVDLLYLLLRKCSNEVKFLDHVSEVIGNKKDTQLSKIFNDYISSDEYLSRHVYLYRGTKQVYRKRKSSCRKRKSSYRKRT